MEVPGPMSRSIMIFWAVALAACSPQPAPPAAPAPPPAAAQAVAKVPDESPDDFHRRIVKLHLTDPDSAVFRQPFKAKYGGDVWCGEINAKNRYGGMAGFRRYIAEMPPPATAKDDRSLVEASWVTPEGADGFDAKWNLMCIGQ